MEFTHASLPPEDTSHQEINTEDYEVIFHLYSIKEMRPKTRCLEYHSREKHNATTLMTVRKIWWNNWYQNLLSLNEKWIHKRELSHLPSQKSTEISVQKPSTPVLCPEPIEHQFLRSYESWMDYARNAIRYPAAITPIRGGTDGAQIFAYGFPCPNSEQEDMFYYGPAWIQDQLLKEWILLHDGN